MPRSFATYGPFGKQLAGEGDSHGAEAREGLYQQVPNAVRVDGFGSRAGRERRDAIHRGGAGGVLTGCCARSICVADRHEIWRGVGRGEIVNYEAALAGYEKFDFTDGPWTRPVWRRGSVPR